MTSPDNPGPNDDLFKQLEGLDDNLDDIVNVRKLSDPDLGTYAEKVRQELLERREMTNPTTERGRELHSLRNSTEIELRRRGYK